MPQTQFCPPRSLVTAELPSTAFITGLVLLPVSPSPEWACRPISLCSIIVLSVPGIKSEAWGQERVEHFLHVLSWHILKVGLISRPKAEEGGWTWQVNQPVSTKLSGQWLPPQSTFHQTTSAMWFDSPTKITLKRKSYAVKCNLNISALSHTVFQTESITLHSMDSQVRLNKLPHKED
jgi:hypothetical protein